MERLQGLIDRKALPAEEVFYLHDTLGFPVELSAELAGEQGVTVDMTEVATLMQGQRERSRVASGGFTAPLAGRATRFVGYDRLDVDTSITDVFAVAGDPGQADVFLEETPFYAERGGQKADTRWLTWDRAQGVAVDGQPQGEAIRHPVAPPPARLKPPARVRAP